MIVAELMAKLSECNPSAELQFYDADSGMDADMEELEVFTSPDGLDGKETVFVSLLGKANEGVGA